MLAKFCHCFVKKKFCHRIFAWFCHCRCLWISNFISEKGSSRDQLEKSVWINWPWGEASIQEYLRGFPCDASLHSKLQMENHNYSSIPPESHLWVGEIKDTWSPQNLFCSYGPCWRMETFAGTSYKTQATNFCIHIQIFLLLYIDAKSGD
jgi:hypothetical protein